MNCDDTMSMTATVYETLEQSQVVTEVQRRWIQVKRGAAGS